MIASRRQLVWKLERLARRYGHGWRVDLRETHIVGRDIPDVMECYNTKDHKGCAQCDGNHQHRWRRCIVLNGGGYPDIATRCKDCGARKCDNPGCNGRRHHTDPHTYANGRVEKVGT